MGDLDLHLLGTKFARIKAKRFQRPLADFGGVGVIR